MSGTKGRSGRIPKPTHLHILEGTYEPSRHGKKRKGEPMPKRDGRLPPPPAYLEPEVRDAWDNIAETLTESRIWTSDDLRAFETFAGMWAVWRRVSKQVRDDGPLTVIMGRDKREIEVIAPWTKIWMDLNNRLMTYFDRFGMTPAARTRTREIDQGGADGKQTNPDEEFTA